MDSIFRLLLIMTLVCGFIYSVPTSLDLYSEIIKGKGNENQITTFNHELSSLPTDLDIGYVYKPGFADFPKEYYQLQHALIPIILERHEMPVTIFSGYDDHEILTKFPGRRIIKRLGSRLSLTTKLP